MLRSFLLLVIAFCVSLSIHSAQKPNIVLVLVDDMGFADLGCYGADIIETPHLDKLAANGLRFKQFYNTARCSPTRASLLTGLHPHQAGVGYLESLDKGEGHPGYRGRLNDQCVTIAEVLREEGYLTAISGKWHVGGSRGVVPWKRGFDRSLTAINAAFYYPSSKQAQTMYLNGEPIDPYSDKLPKDWYASDLFADFGLRFIDEAIEDKKPFFLYLAFSAPHFPLQAPSETIAKYKGKFSEGWERLREPIYRKQIEMGLIDANWPLSPLHPDVPDWDKLKPEHRDRMEHIQEIYAACVDRMDLAMGTLVDELEERGVFENTLLVFMSDNGACAEQGPFGRYSGPERSGTARSSVFQGQSWANYSDTPFRMYKHFTHEGGIATPCIVHWPDGIKKSKRGGFIEDWGHIVDVMPTFLEVAGAQYPKEYKGNKIQPMEGTSFVRTLKGKSLKRKGPVFWEHEGNRGGRLGKWKIVSILNQPWELYDMEKDRTEQVDISAEHPQIFQKLITGYDAYAKRINVEPWTDTRNSAGQPPQIEAKYQIKDYTR